MNQNQKRKALVDIGYELSVYYASTLPGEEFHKDYQKYKDVFRKITKSDQQLEKALKQYFKQLSKDVAKKIDWNRYSVMKASIADLIDADWEDETLNLKIILTDHLVDAIVAGGTLTQLETSIDVGFTAKSANALSFLNKYSLKLAGNLTDTTIDKVKKSLALSLGNGESQDEAAARIADIIDDPARAAMIAHTEAVRAFSSGRLEVAEEIGADRKQWSATLGACPICQPLDDEIVDLNENFSSGDDSPPAHPNCRCIVRILMPNE